MKEIENIFKLFSDYGLSHEDVIKFCQLVLKDKRKSVDKIEKYDAILESPFISLLLKDNFTLSQLGHFKQ